MNAKVREIIYASSILPVLALCLLNGQGNSPFKFIFFPLIVLLAFRMTHSGLLKTGFTFGMLFAVISFARKPPDSEIPTRVAELFSMFLVTAATGFVIREMETEKGRSAKASATFQVVSEELQQKSRELQASLDALSKAHQQLQANNHSRSRFLANVSHELRTPLTSIRSYSEILRDYDDIDDATRREFIHTIYDESERMTLLVNKYLDLLRMGSGKSEMILSAVNSRLLIEVAVKVVAPMAEKKGLPIDVDLPENFPHVRGDLNLMTQVFVNILGNAVKFTSSGRITAGARLKEEMAEFYVADTGEGIFPDEKEVIFDEFFRISGALPDRPAGSGLGLAISRQIVEQHGGQIWVESTPGKGSTFFFTVPVYTEETAIAEPEPFYGKAETALPSEPILVVSESIVLRQTLRKFLEGLGYRTIGADTLKRGLDVTSEIGPGLIITDTLEGSGDFRNLGNWARDAG
ncbi:MAG TPA: ATP-binding protein, partial [Geobacteraceae bacterium]